MADTQRGNGKDKNKESSGATGNNTNQDEDPNSAAKFFDVEEDEEKPSDRAGLRGHQGTGGICTDNGGDNNTKSYTVTLPKERNEGKWRVIALLEEDYKMAQEIIKEELWGIAVRSRRGGGGGGAQRGRCATHPNR